MISAKVIAHSKNAYSGAEIFSMVLKFPRFILAELNTHRVLSKNSASSRAIPFKKMLKLVMNDPFIPIAWQKDHKGMQGTKYFEGGDHPFTEVFWLRFLWLTGRTLAVAIAWLLSKIGVTKQLCNRLLEPFMWHTVLVTGTEWDNFFDLRCPQYSGDHGNDISLCFKSRKEALIYLKNKRTNTKYLEKSSLLEWLAINKGMAEIHMMALAEAIYDAQNESIPKILQPGEWHIPYGDDISERKIIETFDKINSFAPIIMGKFDIEKAKLEIATTRCAWISYLNHEGTDDYEKCFRSFKRLKDDKHASPFEHCAQTMLEQDYDNYLVVEAGKVKAGVCRNFTGFIQYRAILGL
jgi:hypothetical protein